MISLELSWSKFDCMSNSNLNDNKLTKLLKYKKIKGGCSQMNSCKQLGCRLRFIKTQPRLSELRKAHMSDWNSQLWAPLKKELNLLISFKTNHRIISNSSIVRALILDVGQFVRLGVRDMNQAPILLREAVLKRSLLMLFYFA